MGVPKSLDYKDFMSKSTSANPTTWNDMYRFSVTKERLLLLLLSRYFISPTQLTVSGPLYILRTFRRALLLNAHLQVLQGQLNLHGRQPVLLSMMGP